MTQIGGFIKPNRRPGELGVHSLDHFHFVVPDLSVAEHFYGEFGLDIKEKGNGLAINTHGHPHEWGTIGEGPRKKHSYMSFGAYEDDFDKFSERLQAMGIRFGIRAAGAGKRGAPFRSTMGRTQPRRLAHILMFTRDVSKAIEFYTHVLGMRLSDRSGDNIAFLHGIHGSDHHMIAFARSNAPGHHHFSWDVGTVDEIGEGAMHMLDKGFSKGWGLGRHVLGSNFFHYVQDPWGSFCEYSADIDYVPADCDWPAGDHPPEDSFYAWGPNVPEDFVHNYEA